MLSVQYTPFPQEPGGVLSANLCTFVAVRSGNLAAVYSHRVRESGTCTIATIRNPVFPTARDSRLVPRALKRSGDSNHK